ncbi:hypothetical protein BG842_05435 [Haladaptatus sp. W1]|uniref:antibiotic biosynthesis monooxygenase n=1 Tax=Haladaptatus sp. W1 TaxID=1897478 RepID=UPI000849BF53|nr:antibiotic biosynthesis monooxygenase [Haladaptatus sp. W1]ODR81274.1 hypothetical protein BG842_05435 [Haladaptatus sp. W1]
MSDAIVYADQARVREGKLDELEEVMADLVEFVEENEPQILSYDVYFSADGTRMTVIHVHPDSASLEFHMDIGREKFLPIGEFMEIQTIDVYGRPNEKVLEQLHDKASTLGSGAVSIHELHHGFERFAVG